MRPRRSRSERFNAAFMPVTESGCWLWLRSLTAKGYGKFGDRYRKIWHLAHRISWELHHGHIPDGMMVLHKCDVRCCVNPDHLFLGTAADNLHDMVAKGRRSFIGSASPRAILHERNIPAIYHDPRPLSEIASDYGVSESAIYSIKQRHHWKHVQV